MRASLCVFVLAFAAQGCDSTKCDDPRCDGGIVGMSKDPPPISGGGCDSTKTKEEGGCRVSDVEGIFVSGASGADGAPGTMGAPVKSIAAALMLARGGRRDVYICAGTYEEQLSVAGSSEGIALHGGFGCEGGMWRRSGALTSIKPAQSGPVVRIDGSPVVIEDLELVARDGAMAGDSSVTVQIADSPVTTLRRARVVAGKGMNGAPGATDGTNLGAAQAGFDATSSKAADTRTCACGSETTSGGQGGDGVKSPAAGTPKIMGAPANAGAPGMNGAGLPCNVSVGSEGAAGLAGAEGVGASALGTLSKSGWSPAKGTDGAAGGVGQGGGGAGGFVDAFGGGGGCGGCGGKGGGGGGGGGGSIGVISVGSTLRLVATAIVTDRGGDGGPGGAGQAPQLGGAGGQGKFLNNVDYCGIGGKGGAGGAGGRGGAGAGGVSFGIAHTGDAPDVDAMSTITVGGAALIGSVPGEAKPVRAF